MKHRNSDTNFNYNWNKTQFTSNYSLIEIDLPITTTLIRIE